MYTSYSQPDLSKNLISLEFNSPDLQIAMLRAKLIKKVSTTATSLMFEAQNIDLSPIGRILQTYLKDMKIQKAKTAATALKKNHLLLKNSSFLPSLQTFIQDLSEKGYNRTCLFHQIVFDNLISPLAQKITPQKKKLLKKIFTNSGPAFAFSPVILKNYKSLSDLLCPVKPQEIESKIKSLSFEEVVSNLRVFLDMNEILSKEFQGEFFDFVCQLRYKKTKDDFISHIKESYINIDKDCRDFLFTQIEESFKQEKVNLKALRTTLIKTLSSKISSIWTEIKWNYLEALQKNENDRLNSRS